MVDSQILNGELLDLILSKKMLDMDTENLRMAGRIAWNLENMKSYLNKSTIDTVEEIDKIKDEESLDRLRRKVAGDELFPDE